MNLRQLGLSEYEEKAYRALVELGKSSASKIARQGEISYGKIYEVLNSLEAKGLIKIIPEETKKFVASDPKSLMKLIDKKEKDLLELKKDIKNLKQSYEVHKEEIVQVVKGKKNFYKLAKASPPAKKFSYSIKYTGEYHPDFVKGVKAHKRKGVDSKTLMRNSEETKKNIKKWLKVTPHIRKIENKGVAIGIDESGVLIVLLNNNMSLLIKDKAFGEMMGVLFRNTYKNAEKVR